MGELKVTFTLSGKDVAHLRRLIRRATHGAGQQSESSILAGAERLAKDVRSASPPGYVLSRVEKLEALVRMVQDEEWAIPTSVRKKVLGALAYFAQPSDLIPDSIPGLGFLDDAIMVELVAQDLRHEIWGYGKFLGFRQTSEQRPWTRVAQESLRPKLVQKRRQIRAEIQRRQTRDQERARAKGTGISKFW